MIQLLPGHIENLGGDTALIKKGKLEQAQEMSIKIVSGRFGECSTELLNVIKQLPLEILDLIPEKIFSLNSLDEWRRWLDEKLEASKKD